MTDMVGPKLIEKLKNRQQISLSVHLFSIYKPTIQNLNSSMWDMWSSSYKNKTQLNL